MYRAAQPWGLQLRASQRNREGKGGRGDAGEIPLLTSDGRAVLILSPPERRNGANSEETSNQIGPYRVFRAGTLFASQIKSPPSDTEPVEYRYRPKPRIATTATPFACPDVSSKS